MTDFRALCAELVEKLDELNCHYNVPSQSAMIERAHAALADEPAVPTVMEIVELADEIEAAGLGQVDLVRAALTRWGNPAPQPVPVSERLPKPEDCDANGRCWWWHPSHPESGYSEGWMRRPRAWGVGHYDVDDRLTHTHWLPAHALPVPGQEVEG